MTEIPHGKLRIIDSQANPTDHLYAVEVVVGDKVVAKFPQVTGYTLEHKADDGRMAHLTVHFLGADVEVEYEGLRRPNRAS